MDYADAVASFADPLPSPAPVPLPTAEASLARRLRDAIEPIAMHPVWSRTTNERLAGLGLNFLTGYVWGRAASLGEPEPGVVVSAFAVFNPDLITAAYTEGRAAVDRDEMLTARAESTISSLTDVLDDADVTEIAERLRSAVTTIGGMGRPLFSGLRDQAWPTTPAGILWHACELAREHRGDGHVAICLSEGLDPIKMNVLTELFVGLPLGSYSASRAWGPDQIADAAEDLRAAGLLDDDGLTAPGLEFRREIEARTDALDQPLIDAIGDVESMLEPLLGWSQRCIDTGAFPPDPFKRAAG
jgi:hypothetical protein